MKRKLTRIVPLVLLVAVLITACELQRPGGDAGDISVITPEIAPPQETAAVETPTEPLLEETAPPPADQPEDIDAAGVPAAQPPPPDAVEPGKVLLKLNPQAAIQARRAELGSDDIVSAGINTLDQKLQQLGASELEPVVESVGRLTGQNVDQITVQTAQLGQLYSVSFDPTIDTIQAAQILAEDPTVEFAEPNFIASIAGEPQAAPPGFEPNDQYYRFQWHLQSIGAPAAWDIATGQDVIVAVVDTGIDFNAPDLASTNRLPGYDFVGNDNDPTDDQSHGSHVAGTIAQSTNNGIGVAGVAFNARLLPVKVLGSDGNGSYENIIKGITYAVNQGAKVINMSLAGSSASAGLEEAVRYARSRGVVVVAAAGNNGRGSLSYPAAYNEYVIAVGATRFDRSRTSYSNYGPGLDLMAPGGDVDVDQNGDGYADGVLQQTLRASGGYSYQFFEGTSMAAPHVAGVAALLLSRRPDALPADVESVLAQTAINLGNPSDYGAGLIQADKALLAFTPQQPVTSTPTRQPQPPTNTPVLTLTPTNTPFIPTVTNTPFIPTATPTPSPTSSPTSTSTPVPVITATPTPSPTSSPSPSPTTPPQPAGELLTNGSFETDEGWTFGNTPVRGSFSADTALSGGQSLKLGLDDGTDRYSYTSAWQKITIPAQAKQVTLSANVYTVSQDRIGRDYQNIFILNENFRILRTLYRSLSDNQTWEPVSYDLSSLSGQTIYVYFGVFNNGYAGRPTAMYIDDVSLQWAQ